MELDSYSYCASSLSIDKSYFVVSVSTLYVKFNESMNKGIKFDDLSGVMLANQEDLAAYEAGTLPTTSHIPFSFVRGGYKVYNSHLIIKLDIATKNVEKGVFILKVAKRRYLNNSKSVSFYTDDKVVVANINYYHSEASFEKVLGIIFGVVLGLTGFLALFIPAIKYTIMSMKIFQMNNYFFTMNVNLPINLFLFFENIQYGNIIRLAVIYNPLSFLANDTCKEFQEKLLALDKTCQLFHNAGPHMLWFGISAILKGGLEGWQWYQEKQGHPRGKLYEFLKLKFGKRYFIEMLNYFHMDLVLYNLMNLLFSEMDNLISFINLFVSVILMVFFIYFYIQLFVIVSLHYQDYLSNNLCDPFNKLGTIAAKQSDHQDNIGSMHELPDPNRRKSGRKSTRNAGNNFSKVDITGAPNLESPQNKPADAIQKPATRLGWDIRRLFEELKFRKFKLPLDKDAEKKDQFRSRASVARLNVFKKLNMKEEERKDDTFEPCNIYRFIFINSHCLNLYSANYYPITFVKEFVLAVVLVVSYSSGIMQSLVFLVIFMTIFIFTLIMEPLQNELNNRLLKIYTALYMVMSIITFALNIFDESVNPALLYNFFGYILILLEIGIICTLVIMTVSQFIKTRNDKKMLNQKAAVHPDNKTELKPLTANVEEKSIKDDERAAVHPDNKTELKPLTAKVQEKSIKNTEKDAPRPVSAQSHASIDSFQRIGINLPKKVEKGDGIFFRPRDFGGVDQNGDRLESKNSFTSKHSWKMGRRQMPVYNISRNNPIPKRVDSFTEEISIDGLHVHEQGMEENSIAPPSKTQSKSSRISKVKSRGTNKTGSSNRAGSSNKKES